MEVNSVSKRTKNIVVLLKAIHDFIFTYNAKNIQPFRSLWVNLYVDYTVFGAFLPCIVVYYNSQLLFINHYSSKSINFTASYYCHYDLRLITLPSIGNIEIGFLLKNTFQYSLVHVIFLRPIDALYLVNISQSGNLLMGLKHKVV